VELKTAHFIRGEKANMEIELIEDAQAFFNLSNDWNLLLEKSTQLSIFLTWEWLYTWWSHFHFNRKLFILLARKEPGAPLAGIAPLCLEIRRGAGVLSLKTLCFLGADKVASDFMDFILEPGKETELLAAMQEFILSRRGQWDMLELGDMDASSLNLDWLRAHPALDCRMREEPFQVCPYIALPADYPAFFNGLNPKWRQYLRSKIKRLDETQVTFTVETQTPALPEAIARLFILHNSRFASKTSAQGAVSNFRGAQMESFHQDVAAAFSRRGWLRLFYLRNADDDLACLYAFQFQNRLYVYQTGFNVAWHQLGVGNVLFNHAIRTSIEAQLKEFHFLRGDEAYKAKWTLTSKQLLTTRWIRRNVPGRLYAGFLAMKDKIKHLLVTLGLRPVAGAPLFGPAAKLLSE
jgi:CelD/BcsL family acetyltransferase involved in cellulose biosynthesis